MSAYKIVVDKEGCQHCGGERTWTIEGPDEVCIGTSWGDEEFASDICDLMNMAFDAGKEAPAPEGGALVAAAALEEACIIALAISGHFSANPDEWLRGHEKRLRELEKHARLRMNSDGEKRG